MRLPGIRHARAAQLRGLRPLADGKQRGTPVVRHYWDDYLRRHQTDIRGRALEVGTTATLERFRAPALDAAEAIDLQAHSPEVTVVADLARADGVPGDQYDCFINQFTYHLIYDVEAALYHSVRLLKPGGVLLANFPCVDYYFHRGLDMGTGAPLFMYWWFTPVQVENLLRGLCLSGDDYSLTVYGNLFTRIAYQMNLPAEELTPRELGHTDPGYPLLICARVVRPLDWQAQKPEYRRPWLPDVTPARWNEAKGHFADGGA